MEWCCEGWDFDPDSRAEFVQCRLIKGKLHQTSWIPKRYAHFGRVLKLREQETWDDGWVVQEVGSFVRTGRELEGMQLPGRPTKTRKRRK